MIVFKTKVGTDILEYSGENIKKIFEFSALFGSLPKACDACKSPEIFLNFRNIKGNSYYILTCKKCGAELKFGQKKDGGGLFVRHDEKMTVYQKGAAENSNPDNGAEEPSNGDGF